MGLNLETLIGILVVLIILILLDGVRRMIKERRSRLRLRIDPRISESFDDDDENAYPEVLGAPRVVPKRHGDLLDLDETPQQSETAKREEVRRRNEPVFIQDKPSAPKPIRQPAVTPPPEPAEPQNVELPLEPVEAYPEPVQADIDDGDDLQPEPAPVATPSTAAKRDAKSNARGKQETAAPKRSVDQRPIDDVIIVHLVARKDNPFSGSELLSALIENDLRFGEMNIFHRHVSVNGNDDLQFSMANAVEPGTFDIHTMEDNTFAGVTFFLKLPGPKYALDATDDMLSICRRLADQLGGELLDEARSVLTRQTMTHLRERVQEFERRQRLSARV